MRHKTVRRKAVRLALLASNVAVLALVTGFVIQNQRGGAEASSVAALSSSTPAAAENNPLDQVSSADIALTVARMGGLPETTAVNNQAQSQAADVARAASTSSDNVVSKPQIVNTSLKSSADIKSYVTKDGDSITSVASQFGVTSDSIRWSNNLTGDNVASGLTLSIPPVNGIVYTIQSGDTPDSLATKFSANKDQIIAFNDGEINGLRVGSKAIIPDGKKAAVVTYAASSMSAAALTGAGSFSAQYGGNGYDYGYCTWYVANRMPVPANWGNANTWAYYAALSGWKVSKTPVPGAIAQSTSGYYGHVAVVESVNEDGSIKYSDMNGIAGWGRAGTSTTNAGHFNNYIYR